MNSIVLITAMTATTGLFGGGKHCGGGGKMHHKTKAAYVSAPAPAPCGSMMSYATPMQGSPAMTPGPASPQSVPPAPMVPMASPGAPPAPPKPIM